MSEFFDKDIENGKKEEDSTYHYSYVEEDPNVENDPNVEYVEEVIEEVVEEEPKKEKRKPKKKRKPMSEFTKKLTRMAAYGLVFGLVGGAAFQGVSYGLNKVGIAGGNQKQLATTQTVSTSSGSKSDVSAVAESVLPSIVSITGTFQTNSYGFYG